MPFWKRDQASTEYLEDVAFFENFTRDELEQVARLGSEVEAVAGAELIDQGDTGRVCYVIVEGTANVYVAQEHVATLEAGSMVGEMALIDHRPRTATVIAETPMKLLAFDTNDFRVLLQNAKASERIMAVLGQRLKQHNAEKATGA
ncbi:MAG: cyclic nucleotide-binding domain-containing protein [Actinomycetota bacterium]|nr:cyclic nucleotide-binding domain-containing protein [Actinomycetota bacterium]